MKRIKSYLNRHLYPILIKSLNMAAEAQGLSALKASLRAILPDIKGQYSSFKVDNTYLENKVRNMHAFQISLISRVISKFKNLVVVDIGDSSGTHIQYLNNLYSDKGVESLSVNIDGGAVTRIKNKGLNAIRARAEDIDRYNINADIFLCFELLEHLMNPVHFLHELSTRTRAEYLIVTVPYLKKSRVGLHHLRAKDKTALNAENTHIFEFCPKDWQLLFNFSGWRVAFENIYLQYPTRHWLYATKPYWRIRDFEGFYGAILTRELTWSNTYTGW